MKHIIKVEVLQNLPEIRPLLAMDATGNLFAEGKIPAPVIHNDEIHYIAISQVTPNDTDVFGATYLPEESTFDSTTHEGILKFDGNVTSIGNLAFWYCTSLTSITIPNSVTNVGDSAFYNCTGLTSITIPNNVTSIGSDAFTKGLANPILNSIIFESTTPISLVDQSSSIIRIFGNPSYLSDFNIYVPTGYEETYAEHDAGWEVLAPFIVLPDTIFTYSDSTTSTSSDQTISQSSYNRSKTLTSVKIGTRATSIGNNAFENCNSLTSVTIGNNVTSIGDDAFCWCWSLTSVTIPNSVTSIGGEAFRGCSGLTSVTIPNSVTSIGSSAFSNCSCLTSVMIGNNVTNIGNYAFLDCSYIEDMTFLSTTPVNLEDEYGNAIDIFDIESGYGPSNLKIHVPSGYEHTYENYDAGWEILTPYIVGL